jgi:hypothetical protein
MVPLPGRCVSAGTLVMNYCATNVAPTQKHQPLISSKRGPHSQAHLGTNRYLVIGSDGA